MPFQAGYSHFGTGFPLSQTLKNGDCEAKVMAKRHENPSRDFQETVFPSSPAPSWVMIAGKSRKEAAVDIKRAK